MKPLATYKTQPLEYVGRARWNFGSFYLWGDVPALMPMAKKFKQPGTREETKNAGGSWFNVGSPGQREVNRNPVHEATKQPGISGPRDNGKGDRWFQDGAARHGSKSSARKAASALIAKIPLVLARHVGAVCYPREAMQ